jgi:RNA polymerase sigma factor (TIGR02999 family)
MMAVSVSNVTELLESWREGDPSALTRLTPLIYNELRRIAHRYTQGEGPGHTLQTTALVNEAYLRLAKQEKANWQDHHHFFAATAQVMRHILIDHARRRRYGKHGGDLQRVPLDDALQISEQRAAELIALDEALSELKELDARKHRVVEMRYFGGLSLEETATALDVSEMTVRRDWRAARAWLYRRVNGES